MTGPDAIEVSVHISAEPETVFAYFTDASKYVQWMGTKAQLDPTPGGVYGVHMRPGVEVSGQFVRVDPPHLVEFTWGWSHDPAVPAGSTRVVVTLTPEGNGTRVVLRHHDLPSDEQCDHHKAGWSAYLDRLTDLVSGNDPGPDPNG